MSNTEVREGLRLLNGIENGTLSASDAYTIADQRDPTLVYFVFRYLREKYAPGRPESAGVLKRLLELTGTYDDLMKKTKAAEKDPLKEWFDDSHNMREFFASPDGFVQMIVDKIEG